MKSALLLHEKLNIFFFNMSKLPPILNYKYLYNTLSIHKMIKSICIHLRVPCEELWSYTIIILQLYSIGLLITWSIIQWINRFIPHHATRSWIRLYYFLCNLQCYRLPAVRECVRPQWILKSKSSCPTNSIRIISSRVFDQQTVADSA